MRRLKVTVVYLHEGFRNPGDGFAYMGARRLVEAAFDVLAEFSLSPAATLLDEDLEAIPEPDLIVVAGAPWFWDGAPRSEKVGALEGLIDHWKTSLWVGIGPGAALLPDQESDIGGPEANRYVADIFRFFDLLVVRDQYASDLLKSIGVPNLEGPDPTWFLPRVKGKKRRTQAVIESPPDQLFISEFIPREEREAFAKDVGVRLGDGHSYFRWANSDLRDSSVSSALGFGNPIRVLRILAGFRKVFTNRVHVAALVRNLGNKVELWVHDSRSLLATSLGAAPVGVNRLPFPRHRWDRTPKRLTFWKHAFALRKIGRKIEIRRRFS